MAASNYGFGRSVRLVLPEDFKQALSTRPVARTDHFLCHFIPVAENESTIPAFAKFGFVVPKRLARLAVRRNTIKRVLRESFRVKQDKLPIGHIVIRLKAPLKAVSLTELRSVVREQADQLFRQLRQSKK